MHMKIRSMFSEKSIDKVARILEEFVRVIFKWFKDIQF